MSGNRVWGSVFGRTVVAGEAKKRLLVLLSLMTGTLWIRLRSKGLEIFIKVS